MTTTSAAKQPWEMRREEWTARRREAGAAELKALKAFPASPYQKSLMWGTTERIRLEYGADPVRIRKGGRTFMVTHEAVVRKAVSEGKPVPPEVLAEYAAGVKANPEVQGPLMSNYEWARGAMSTHLLSQGNMATFAPRLNSKNFKAAVKILKEAASEGHQWAKELLEEAGVRAGARAKNPPGDVPNTTWRQIPLMTKMRLGAREPVGSGDTLTFAVTIKPGHYAYKFSIRLDPSDTYSVTLYKIRKGRTFQEVETVGDIYNDALGEALERMSEREYRRRVAGQ